MMENPHFVPSYKIPENNQDGVPTFYVNKAEIKPIYREYSPSVLRDQDTKDDKFLKTLYINNYPSSSSSSSLFKTPSSSSFFPSNSATKSSVPSFKTPIVGRTQTKKPNPPILQHSGRKMNLTRSELFPSASNNGDSYGRPLANVIQTQPAESYSDSYGQPLGDIITNQGAGQPLSTTSLSLNNLNQEDSYGRPLSPLIAGEPGLALVVDSESAPVVSRTGVTTTEVPGRETNTNLFTDVLAVFPQLRADSNSEGRYLSFVSVLSSIFCQEITLAGWMMTREMERKSRHQ